MTTKHRTACLWGILLATTISQLPASTTEESVSWELIADNLTSTDAPCVDAHGNIYFCDMRGTPPVIWRLGSAGEREKVFEGLACSGLKFDAQGRLFGCAFSDGQLVEIDMKNRTQRVVTSDLRPNDLVVAGQRAYITETSKKQVTVVNLDSGEVRPVDQRSVNAPNGVVLISDRQELLVSDFRGEYVWRFKILVDGNLADGRTFAKMKLPADPVVSSNSTPRAAKGDGMALDGSGRLYVATAVGVQIFDKTGELLRILPKPSEKSLTSCLVVGSEQEYLYVTGGDRVYRMRIALADRKDPPLVH
jgi:sugar lactone lactonase YvrE